MDEDERSSVQILFTAHSIPLAMANASQYVAQLRELIELVAFRVKLDPSQWRLVYQSRSGAPQDLWLEPDVCDALESCVRSGRSDRVLLVPIGFLSDHMEVAYDLDVEASAVAGRAGIRLVRAPTPGAHPHLVTMIRELIENARGI